VIVFGLYLLLGESNIFKNQKLDKEIANLERDLQGYKKTIADIKTQNSFFSMNSKEDQEKYFRKHHYLKKDNEDIFRIVSNHK